MSAGRTTHLLTYCSRDTGCGGPDPPFFASSRLHQVPCARFERFPLVDCKHDLMYSRRCADCTLRPVSELLAWDSTVSTDSPLCSDSTHPDSRDRSNFLAQTACRLHSFDIAWKRITPCLPACIRMHDMFGCTHCPVDPFSHTLHRNSVCSVVVCLGCDESPWFRSVVQGLPSFPFACLVWFGTCGCVSSGLGWVVRSPASLVLYGFGSVSTRFPPPSGLSFWVDLPFFQSKKKK